LLLQRRIQEWVSPSYGWVIKCIRNSSYTFIHRLKPQLSIRPKGNNY
jgi:hypothetical protein